ncbi:uncharacterized protein LOC128126048 [Lactuca sativa]|uniref:Uncharacterized protein n=1 Tax=Lactuca sativa TaxID=4236 RepID=A0A9R1XXQ3_LACSA|nr:uncharacterized protein LOC128126048 [Lactuca sativa]KAJ0225182.1 hypothetical protein LSAT_V11C100001740 [Lactuca sativa]
MEAWNRLRNIFQVNKISSVVTLEVEFSNTIMENFPNVSAYCQRLKSLVDQLKNVGAPTRYTLTLEEESFTKGVATWLESSMVTSLQSEDSFVPKSNLDHMHNRGKQSGNWKTGRKSSNDGGCGSGMGQGSSGGSRGSTQ